MWWEIENKQYMFVESHDRNQSIYIQVVPKVFTCDQHSKGDGIEQLGIGVLKRCSEKPPKHLGPLLLTRFNFNPSMD